MRNYFLLFFPILYSTLGSGQEFTSNILKGNDVPYERHENGLAAVDNKLVLIGGRGEKPVDIYDITQKTWNKGAQPPLEIHHMQAVTLDGLIYVIGGFTGSWPFETPLSHVLVYDISQDLWTIGSEIPGDRRRGSAAAVVYNKKIYLINGIINGHTSGWVNWLDEYDPYSNTWEKLPNSPVARDHFQAGVVGDQLYVGGGRQSGSKESGFAGMVKQTNVYNFKTKKWEILADIPTPRAGTAAVIFKNKYIVMGGESDNQEVSHNEIEAFDPSSNTWESLTPLITGRHGTQAVSFGNHIIIGSGSGNRGGGPELTSFEVHTIKGSDDINSRVSVLEKAELTTSKKEITFKGNDSREVVITNNATNKAVVISYLQLENIENFIVNLPHDFPLILAPGQRMSIDLRAKGVRNSTTTLLIKSLGKTEPLKIRISK